MRLVWTKPAGQDLQQIFEYIAEENPHAARVVLAEIRKRAASLVKTISN